MKNFIALLAVFSSIFGAASVMACGESLYRVGKGITYREYTAPLPGTILIVAKDETERLLADALSRAGHKVEIVAEADHVSGKLAGSQFDIVLSRFEHSEQVDQAVSSADVDYLPVARHDTEEIQLAQARYTRSLSDDDNIKRFLIQIHRTLKARQV
jgi:hypothetical protein